MRITGRNVNNVQPLQDKLRHYPNALPRPTAQADPRAEGEHPPVVQQGQRRRGRERQLPDAPPGQGVDALWVKVQRVGLADAKLARVAQAEDPDDVPVGGDDEGVGASAEDATDGVPEVFHAGREAPRVRVAMT